MPIQKSASTSALLKERAKRVVRDNLPPGRFALRRVYWKNVAAHIDELRTLANETENAFVLQSDAGDACLAVGVPPVQGTVSHEAFFDFFMDDPVYNCNLLGARAVRLGLPNGGAVFLLPIGGIKGGFEDVFRPAAPTSSDGGLPQLLAELSRQTEALEAAAQRADAAHRTALAAAEMAVDEGRQAKAAAGDAKRAAIELDGSAKRASASRAELEETLQKSGETIQRWRDLAFRGVAP